MKNSTSIPNHSLMQQCIAKITLCCLMLTLLSYVHQQHLVAQIFQNPIIGTNPNTDNPYTTGQTFDGNITVSGIGRGAGLNGSNTNNRYNANNWNETSLTDAIADGDYFEFTLTPNAGYEINFTSFVYTGQASGTGANNLAFRSSVDAFASNIGTPTIGGTTIDLSAAAFQGITAPITFRMYGWGGSGATGTFSINDFAFNGAVVLIAGPTSDPTDYFRSKNNGLWGNTGTWESSDDNINWIDATLTPTSAAQTITIRNGHFVQINADVSIDETIIEAGGHLAHTNSANLTIENGAGDDVIVEGIFEHNGGEVPNFIGTMRVRPNAIVRLTDNVGGASQAYAGNESMDKVFYETDAVFDWNTNSTFATSGQVYFPNDLSQIPIFRINANTAPVGAIANTTINGIYEANGNTTWQNSGNKIFRNGIIGTANVTQAASCGNFIINGNTAIIGGTGSIILDATRRLEVNNSTYCQLISDKTIDNGEVRIANNSTFDAQAFEINGTADFRLNSTATFVTAHPDGIDGNLTPLSGGFFVDAPQTQTYVFNRNGTQNAGTTFLAAQAGGLSVENNAFVNLLQDIAVSQTVNIVEGKLNLNNRNLDLGNTGFLFEDMPNNHLVIDNIGTDESSKGGRIIATNRTVNTSLQNIGGLRIFLQRTGGADYTVDIERQHYQGAGVLIKKAYHVSGAAAGTDTNVRIEYATDELAGVPTTSLRMFRQESPTSFWLQYNTGWAFDAAARIVTVSEVNDFSSWSLGDEMTLLPVEWLSFEAREWDSQSARLTWQTLNENQNQGFEVQKSNDGKDFKTIGFVAGSGNTSQVMSYEFIDEEFNASAYYRILQKDFDGSESYSSILFVEKALTAASAVQIYPNPTQGRIQIVAPTDAHLNLAVYDATGQLLWQVSGNIQHLEEVSSQRLAAQPKGLYIFEIQGQHTTERLKLIKE
ncbi:MAG: T9SS type A sorting domain-containing protein [Bernardetiaceae bacterium]|nr:T9SS type A sorting domain-containing protein [Bernardetiaceae bacterium]